MNDKSVGTDFRYAVEFSKIKRAPSTASQPSPGQPDQRYPISLRVTTRRISGSWAPIRASSELSVLPEWNFGFGCLAPSSSAGFPARCPALRWQQRESYGHASGKSNVQVRGSVSWIDAAGAVAIIRRSGHPTTDPSVTPGTARGSDGVRRPPRRLRHAFRA